MKNKNLLIIIGAIITAALLVGGFLWWRSWRAAHPVSTAPVAGTVEKPGSLGGELYQNAKNPVSNKLPTTNPFGAKTNPFQTETNPLKSSYQNPF